MKNLIITAAFTAALTLGGAASAATTTIFEEDFADDLAAAGDSVLNFTGFDQFTVANGTVDLIQSGDFGITCGVSGACVDLDGSTGNAGFLSSTVLSFVEGVSYTFKAIISGNQRNGNTDTGTFGITGGVFDGSYSLAGGDAFTEFTLDFTAAADFTGSVFFQDNGSDNIGAILDYVSVTADVAPVPLPASALMLIAGLGGLAAMRRRKNAA